jgi:hypothetical protein
VSPTGAHPTHKVLSLSGKGTSPITLPTLADYRGQITFSIYCDTGKFALKTQGRELFSGDCSPGNLTSAQVSREQIDVLDIVWVTAATTSWDVEVFAAS